MITAFYFKLRNLFKYLFYNKHKVSKMKCHNLNHDIYVIGNGPSLNKILVNNVNHFFGKELYVVNDFSLSNFYVKLKPSNYILVDPAYWSGQLNDPFKKETLENIRLKTNWPLNLIFPINAKGLINDFFNSNINISVYYFSNVSFNANSNSNIIFYWLYRRNLLNPHIQNVLVYALFLAINRNCKRIYLLGAEHSWIKNLVVDQNNFVCTIDDHFYSIENKMKPFLTYCGAPYKIHQLLNDFSKMFLGYHLISEYAKFANCEIFNLSCDSYIDSFIKREF